MCEISIFFSEIFNFEQCHKNGLRDMSNGMKMNGKIDGTACCSGNALFNVTVKQPNGHFL